MEVSRLIDSEAVVADEPIDEEIAALEAEMNEVEKKEVEDLTEAEKEALKQKYYNMYMRMHSPWVKAKEPGRNDPCPCGSGKKYKNCCGKDKKSSYTSFGETFSIDDSKGSN